MRNDEKGGLAPVPGYFTSQMLLMDDLAASDEMPGFDIVEYGTQNIPWSYVVEENVEHVPGVQHCV